MLAAKSKKLMSLQPETWLETCLTGHWLSPKNALFNGKILFLWLANTGAEPPFLTCKVKRKVNCSEWSVELTLDCHT